MSEIKYVCINVIKLYFFESNYLHYNRIEKGTELTLDIKSIKLKNGNGVEDYYKSVKKIKYSDNKEETITDKYILEKNINNYNFYPSEQCKFITIKNKTALTNKDDYTKIIRYLEPGTTGVVYGNTDGYGRIHFITTNIDGYIHNDEYMIEDDISSNSKYTLDKDTDIYNEMGKQIGTLKAGTTVEITGSYSSGKCTILYEDSTSYMSKAIMYIDTSSIDGNNTSEESTESSNEEKKEEDPEMVGEFLLSYERNIDVKSGYTLQITDIRAILGCPHQFLPNTDPRPIDDNENIDENLTVGRIYNEKIIKQIPLLLMTPGVPKFMARGTTKQRDIILNRLMKGLTDLSERFTSILDSYNGKYYSLQFDYINYFAYVNVMLRAAAVYLGIENVQINGISLGSTNWLYTNRSSTGNAAFYTNNQLGAVLGPYAGCIAFYADCGNSVDDSFSNSTTQSQLASSLNSLSDTGRELNFVLGEFDSSFGTNFGGLVDQGSVNNNIFNNVLGAFNNKSNVINSILSKAQNLLAGGRMVLPEIWSDSSFSRSYSCKLKLVSPSGDKLSVFLNILVPIYHLLAMVLPRESNAEQSHAGMSYYSPFLVRAYSKGLFNIDMGIITDLNVSKGAEGEWTTYGIPTVAEVTFTIKDMYEGMFMSKPNSAVASVLSLLGINQLFNNNPTGIMSNITELDYIANSCGVNINDQEIYRAARLNYVLNFENRITDYIGNGIIGKAGQWVNQKLNNIFGVFK